LAGDVSSGISSNKIFDSKQGGVSNDILITNMGTDKQQQKQRKLRAQSLKEMFFLLLEHRKCFRGWDVKKNVRLHGLYAF
jgi:hypothetical protein